MQQPLIKPVKVIRFNQEQFTSESDIMAVEEPLEIRVGFGSLDSREIKKISVTMRTPGNDFELAVGFLFTEGIIQHKNQILDVKYCTDSGTKENHGNVVRVELVPEFLPDLKKLKRNFYTTSSCGVCGKESIEAVMDNCNISTISENFSISSDMIIKLPQTLRENQQVFSLTGGIHASSIFNKDGQLVLAREDVGRHNALDKLIGSCLLENDNSPSLPLNNSVLLLSGRASFEQIQKAAMAGISVICSVGAPSSLAVEAAEKFNITLIGFLRDNRFNIYTGHSRVAIPELQSI